MNLTYDVILHIYTDKYGGVCYDLLVPAKAWDVLKNQCKVSETVPHLWNVKIVPQAPKTGDSP